jgi:hypothetical protein
VFPRQAGCSSGLPFFISGEEYFSWMACRFFFNVHQELFVFSGLVFNAGSRITWLILSQMPYMVAAYILL